MTADHIAAVLLILTPVWPAVAAAVVGLGRGPASSEGIARRQRECRTVAAAATLLSCGSLLAAMLMRKGATIAPASGSVAWISIPGRGIVSSFQLQLDGLSGPAGIVASLLCFVAVLAARRDTPGGVEEAPPHGAWMLLLCAVLILLLAGDLVLLLAALIVCELVCVMLVPGRMLWARGITTLPLMWIAMSWINIFERTRLADITFPPHWAALATTQPMLTLFSGMCLLVCVMGRLGLYPFCVDVDREFDGSPGRLFWLGCLGSWIPAQYLLLRFAPVLTSGPLGVPSLTSIASLLTVLAAWLALTRPHRAGSLAMIGAGLFALTWIALGSGHPQARAIAAVASLAVLLLFGSFVILAESRGWLQFVPRPRRESERVTTVQKLADAGRRLFYLPELSGILIWPLRQIVELPANLESLRVPEAEIIGDVESPDASIASVEAHSSKAAAWLLPIAGLTSIAAIWAWLLMT